MGKIWASKSIDLKINLRLYSTIVLPTALYASETWKVTSTIGVGVAACHFITQLFYHSTIPVLNHSITQLFHHTFIPSHNPSIIHSFHDLPILSLNHSIIQSFLHSSILHSVIPSHIISTSNHFITQPFYYSTIPSLCNSIIQPFYHSAIPSFNNPIYFEDEM
uniref:Uncharacterized protein n=1 Tax=Octopus bimaculoides TaxID=37653 RepID=A0A0L8GYL1_OCTBM